MSSSEQYSVCAFLALFVTSHVRRGYHPPIRPQRMVGRREERKTSFRRFSALENLCRLSPTDLPRLCSHSLDSPRLDLGSVKSCFRMDRILCIWASNERDSLYSTFWRTISGIYGKGAIYCSSPVQTEKALSALDSSCKALRD